MKKILILITAVILSFLVAELFVGFIIGYPTYGVLEKRKISDYQDFQLLYKPYSKYWNVEGGNKVFKRNNIGLPGTDVNVSSDSKYILVLGNSVVEALQIDPETMATSILQQKLNLNNPGYQVINLAYSGHDPYDLWIRVSYFEKIYKPAYVFLVLQETSYERFKYHKHPLNFELGEDVGKKDDKLITKIQVLLRNHSRLMNVIARGYLSLRTQRNIAKLNITQEDIDIANNMIPPEMFPTIDQYQRKYKEKFILVSIMDNENINAALHKYCTQHSIQFGFNPIYSESRQLHGRGHLDKDGNEELGDFFYAIFEEFDRE